MGDDERKEELEIVQRHKIGFWILFLPGLAVASYYLIFPL
jgi:hypothetical protein